jgi:DNA-binding MarR family transcriptional regulator
VADTRWLTPDELDAWIPLAGLTLFLPGYLDEALKPHGLTFFEYSTLSALSQAADHTWPMTSLAHLANGSLSRMSHTTRRLEQRGWVSRAQCPDDRRVTLVSLTAQGHRTLVDAAPVHVESVRRAVFDVLTPQQVPHLARIGKRIVETINPGGPPSGWARDRDTMR